MTYAADIIRLHAEGLRNKEIAERLGCAPNTVVWHLSTRGLTANRPACIHGHEWTPENTYINRHGHRCCRTCHREDNRRRNGWSSRPDRSGFRHDFFSSPSPASSYIAGLLASDGCVHSRRDRTWAFSQTGDDGRRLVEWVANEVGHVAGVQERKTASGRTAWGISISSRQQVNDLWDIYGIGPRKSLTIQWPTALGAHATSAFCRGYWDGDGTVVIYERPPAQLRFSVCSGSEAFLTGMREALPVRTSFIPRRPPRIAVLNCTGRKAFELGGWLFSDADIYRSRKARTYDRYVTDYPSARWRRQGRELATHEVDEIVEVARVARSNGGTARPESPARIAATRRDQLVGGWIAEGLRVVDIAAQTGLNATTVQGWLLRAAQK